MSVSPHPARLPQQRQALHPLDYLSELSRAQAVRNAYLAWIDCDGWCPKHCPCARCRPLWRFIRANLPVVRREVLR